VLAHAGARTPDIAKGIWNQRIVQCRRDGIDSQVDATLGRWFTPDFLRTSPLTMEWVADMIRSTHPDGYVGAIAAIQKLDHVEALARVACPTLVIAGAHDNAVPPEAALALCTAIPNARYELLRQVAHIGNVEQPALFTELVGGFLQRELQ
jgi:3-oxoadipate enol-lactonase